LGDSFDHLAEFSVFVAKLFELGFDAVAACFGAFALRLIALRLIALWLIALWLIALWLIALWLIALWLIALWLIALWLIALWLILGTAHLLCHLLFGVSQILLDVLGTTH
jgi:hypothetical protein